VASWEAGGPKNVNRSFMVQRITTPLGRRDYGVEGIFKENLIEALCLGKF
jgi:hypothetical protein